jgi:hypothetical protein
MIKLHAGLLALLVAIPDAAVAQESATGVLSNAIAAFSYNQEKEEHWNWTIHETRQLLNGSHAVLQTFPSVTSESVIGNNDRRCNAVTAWGDGLAPYLKDADPDERCRAFNALATPFQVELLLNSTKAKVLDQSPYTIHIEILPDPSQSKSPSYGIRCAAAIKATVELDAPTSHPIRIQGAVVGNGCNGTFQPVVHYETVDYRPMISQFRKGTTFRIVYELQMDKFGNSANSYWISTEQHYVQPWDSDTSVLFYWGRQIPVKKYTTGRYLAIDFKATAREFGTDSRLRFDK